MPSALGSSPLTRGKQCAHGMEHLWMGLIPAHAGKTARVFHPRRRGPAHPRSRGENVTTVTKARAVEGSSPLTRGKPRLFLRTHLVGRLIPAHAGKTQSPHWCAGLTKAHPRSRGENYNQQIIIYRELGSSPLTRGKRSKLGQPFTCARLIPAHAGKTPLSTILDGDCTAHPRSRGENSASRPITRCKAGSSPLTRGKRTSWQTCSGN